MAENLLDQSAPYRFETGRIAHIALKIMEISVSEPGINSFLVSWKEMDGMNLDWRRHGAKRSKYCWNIIHIGEKLSFVEGTRKR